MSKNENQPDDNKVAIGRKIFNQIKYHLELNGQSMAVDKFPPDFPISRRSCYHIARGGWTPEILAKLPLAYQIFQAINEYEAQQ